MKNNLQNLVLGTLLTGCLIITVILLTYYSSNKKMNELSSIEETTICTTMTTTMTVTTTSTATTTTTTTNVTTVTTTTTETTTTTTTTYDFKSRLIDYGYFTGTYYHGEYYNPCPGGSGRMLEDCTPKSDEIKGSVACQRIQEDYDYWVNGRTKVYLEIIENPEMNGWYWVDDACESYSVVDFYFIDYDDCPWHGGLNRTVHLWMEVS